MAELYIIARCNGAGKTTASFTILPEILNCNEFVNADEIARGLSPFNLESVTLEAGRIMLNRIDEMLEQKKDFAFETTLSTKSYVGKIKEAKKNGYRVMLIFFWLENDDLAVERVKSRVKEGGHNIPEETIRRRYFSGLKNLHKLYIPLCDNWIIFNNSSLEPEIVAEGNNSKRLNVVNQSNWNRILEMSE
ncbi:zeta toxin family protein [Crocinitomix catalasitica]|nr:zeta toxin family protein [Crocinitomix catalasitica]